VVKILNLADKIEIGVDVMHNKIIKFKFWIGL
jgi:hypothetical protein